MVSLLIMQGMLVPHRYAMPTDLTGHFVNRRFAVREKVVALTFDDGPGAETTPLILDALKKHGAKATFFVLGKNAERNPLLLQRIVLEGHAIGTHSYSHRSSMSSTEAAQENSRTAEIVTLATGVRTALFRPPYGLQKSALNKNAMARGWASFGWSASSADTATKDPEVVFKNVCFTPNPGEIILLHDIKPHTAAAVPKILDELSRQGFRFVTLPELVALRK